MNCFSAEVCRRIIPAPSASDKFRLAHRMLGEVRLLAKKEPTYNVSNCPSMISYSIDCIHSGCSKPCAVSQRSMVFAIRGIPIEHQFSFDQVEQSAPQRNTGRCPETFSQVLCGLTVQVIQRV
jgi:hypothetical protein